MIDTPDTGDGPAIDVGTDTPEDEHLAGMSNTDDDTPDDGADDAAQKARKEAAGLRKRLRDTESERDTLREQIDTMIAGSVEAAVEAAGYPAELVELIDTAELLDNGVLSPERLSQAIAATVAKFNIARKGRPPQPNPQMGLGAGGQPHGADPWRQAFAPRSPQ